MLIVKSFVPNGPAPIAETRTSLLVVVVFEVESVANVPPGLLVVAVATDPSVPFSPE